MANVLKALLGCIFLLGISSCVKKKKDDFARKPMLENVYSNVILPAYTAFDSDVSYLKIQADSFAAQPNLATLANLKAAFQLAYSSFQYVETYDFSTESTLRNELNSFPADTAQIISNIQSGTYNFDAVNNIRAKGFPALDYLLYRKSATDVVSDFAGNNYKQYLADIVQYLQAKSNAAKNWWSANQNQFVNLSGTDAGSSVGMLVNDLSFALERNRRERVGNALGYVGFVSGGVLQPTVVEGYYSQRSGVLLYENIKALTALYTGAGGLGFDDYLNHLGAEYNGTPLADEIGTQFTKVRTAIDNIPVPFSQAITTHNAEMQTLFLELKKLTVLLKVDMSSQLGVIINYSDNDGD